MMKTAKAIATALTLAAALTACHDLDDDRIPYAPVYIEMNAGQWEVYGVGGAGLWQRFVKSKLWPAGYPYTMAEETGYGGVLLVMNYYGTLQAFDLACPVERRYDVRVAINEDNDAQCPVCGSTYSVFENNGFPLSGPAAEKNYGLTRYYVSRNESAGLTRISN